MNKNGRREFLEQDASIERLANNQPTSSVARVIVLTRMASALSRSCLTFAYSSPGTALVSTTLPLIILSNPIEFMPNFAARRDCGTNDSQKKRSRKSTYLTPQFHADCIHVGLSWKTQGTRRLAGR
jgi:hypothetical protein